MRYHYKRPDFYPKYCGKTYCCNHPVYSKCTLFTIGDLGLAVIQQRYDSRTKHTWWGEIDPWLMGALYFNENFYLYFKQRAGQCVNGLYPTVSIRQIMWALRMKPIKRERWETVFDRREI